MSKLSKRLEQKESWESRKAKGARRREMLALNATQKNQNVQTQIARDNQKKTKIDRIIGLNTGLESGELSFLKEVERKTPKLLDKEYFEAIGILSRKSKIKPISDWVPKGKGKLTQFISLAEHLWSLYPVPKFLWSVFWEPDANTLYPIVQRIAAGESFAKMCQSGEFPLPLTKKQCHTFLPFFYKRITSSSNRNTWW
jgi:hypothetical protein